MTRLALVALLLGACAVGEPAVTTAGVDGIVTAEVISVDHADEVDVCALAAELPGDDVCSLVCDPDAFAARLLDDGMDRGNCYQLRCELPGGSAVTIGVCLP